MIRTTRAARRPRLAVVTCLLLSTAACGLQQSGLDGSVSAQANLQNGGSTTGGGTDLTSTSGGTGTAGSSTGGATTGALPNGTTGSTSTGSSSSSSSTGSTGVQGGASTGTGSSAGGGSGSAGSTTGLAQTPGLKGELTVSYVNVTGFDQLGKVVVVNTASTGDARAQTNAVATYVNAHGGIGGRKLKTVVHDYNAMQASEVNDNNLCADITGTDKAFMAVLHGQIHYSARDCYAAKKVLAFEGAAYGFGKSFYDAHQPYMWSPSYGDYDQSSRALVALIKDKQWLKGETKVGVVLWDDKPYHEIADRTLVPLLKDLGVDVVQATVSNADIGAIEDGIHAAAQTMVVNQVDHLLFLGSAPLQPFFVQQNQQQSGFVYALSTFDVPRYMAKNFPRNMVGAIGVGFSPVDDVLDPQWKFPQAGTETECVNIYKAAGVSVPGRYLEGKFNSKQAMSYCESTLLLKKVADTIPDNLTQAAWTQAAERLGTSYQAAQTFSTSYSGTKHTGAATYRDLAYTPDCSCMTYTSGPKALS